jgi:hypothetical protein
MFKSTRLLIIFLVWIISLNSYSQRIMGEAILGLNMSKVEGDLINNGSLKFQKPGLNVGVGAIIPINDLFSINLQTLFSQKGAYKKFGPNSDSALPYYRTRLDYAEVPLMIFFHDKNGLSLGTGVSYSRLVRVQWTVNGKDRTTSLSDGFFTRDNFDWIADLKVQVWENLHVNARYQFGLNSIWSGEDEDLLITQAGDIQSSDQRHSLISIRLIWVFGMEQSRRLREDVE